MAQQPKKYVQYAQKRLSNIVQYFNLINKKNIKKPLQCLINYVIIKSR